MNLLGMDILTSPALEPGQMLVHSGGLMYGWDLAKDGGECCVVARMKENGDIEIIEVTQSEPQPGRE